MQKKYRKSGRLTSILLLCVLLAGCSGVEVVKEDESLRNGFATLVVFPFQSNRSDTGSNIAGAIARFLSSEGISAVSIDELSDQLAEKGLDPASAVKDYRRIVGKLDGVDAFIVGDASVRALSGYMEHVAVCSVRLVDARTGRVALELRYEPKKRGSWQRTSSETEIGEAIGRQILSRL